MYVQDVKSVLTNIRKKDIYWKGNKEENTGILPTPRQIHNFVPNCWLKWIWSYFLNVLFLAFQELCHSSNTVKEDRQTWVRGRRWALLPLVHRWRCVTCSPLIKERPPALSLWAPFTFTSDDPLPWQLLWVPIRNLKAVLHISQQSAAF